jgi:cellulose synthase/poly-beta-1,6-N-acetylglucosamine synthase-like glycosyltransferase
MDKILNIVFYAFTFAAMYLQVFFLVVFLERRKTVVIQRKNVQLATYPTVSIIVPCWNEEMTVGGTVESLLALQYPKDKIHFYLIDDGSTDGTLAAMRAYEKNPQITVLHKENGGKHTAVNLGITTSTSEFVACLDADSYVAPDALVKMLSYFVEDPQTMAVSPTVLVYKAKNFIERAQKADYTMAAYFKKMFASINGMHVASGSFTIFRREVFEKIGLYKNAHNTEDFEITLRMYAHHMRIDQCNDAYVYTVTPSSARKLFTQRLRWMYGFIQNLKEYRFMLFRKKYGPVALLTLPAGVVSIFAVVYMFIVFSSSAARKIGEMYLYYRDTGKLFHFAGFHFDPFFINTGATFLLLIMMYLLLTVSFLLGQKVYGKKPKISFDLIYFFIIYSIIAPLWLLKALFNSVVRVKTAWR